MLGAIPALVACRVLTGLGVVTATLRGSLRGKGSSSHTEPLCIGVVGAGEVEVPTALTAASHPTAIGIRQPLSAFRHVLDLEPGHGAV